MKRLFSASLVLALSLFIAACSSDDNPVDDGNDTPEGKTLSWEVAAGDQTQFHIIAIPTDINPTFMSDALAAGDSVGAFYKAGDDFKCGGLTVWDGVNNKSVSIYGNSAATTEKDGFDPGETIYWKVKPNGTGKTYDANVTYQTTSQTNSTDGTFMASGGISVLGSLIIN